MTVETPLYRMTLDPRGAIVRQVELLRYESYQSEGPVRLVPEGAAFLARTAEIGDRRLAIDSLMFQPSDSVIVLETGDGPRELTFAHVSAGRRITQSYRFDPADYVVDYRLELGGGDGVLVTALGPRLRTNEKKPQRGLRAASRRRPGSTARSSPSTPATSTRSGSRAVAGSTGRGSRTSTSSPCSSRPRRGC